MKSFIALVLLALTYGPNGWTAKEGETLNIHKITLGFEFSRPDLGDAGIDRQAVNSAPVTLELEKFSDTYVGSYSGKVKVQGVEFDVIVALSLYLKGDGSFSAYSLIGSVRRPGKKYFEPIVDVSANDLSTLQSLVSARAWSNEGFFVYDTAKNRTGRVELVIDVNEYNPF